MSIFADSKHFTAMSRFKDTLHRIFNYGWFVFWLVIIVLLGILAAVIMTDIMGTPVIGWICIFLTLVAVLLYMLIVYVLFR